MEDDPKVDFQFIKNSARCLLNEAKQLKPPIILNEILKCLKSKRGIYLTVQEKEFDDKLSGIYVNVEDKLGILYNKKHHPHRQRFTISHEIGHILLNHQIRGSQNEYINLKNKRNTIESEANVFSSELLIPHKLLRSSIISNKVRSVKDLVNIFNVSEEALWFKLYQDHLDKYLIGI